MNLQKKSQSSNDSVSGYLSVFPYFNAVKPVIISS